MTTQAEGSTVADDIQNPADRLLLTFLDAQRRTVLAIVDGLSDDDLRKPVVPSGWTPLGLIEHLAGAEYYWFRIVAAGAGSDLPGPEETDAGCDLPWPPHRCPLPPAAASTPARRRTSTTCVASCCT
jgi:hypothetical protein